MTAGTEPIDELARDCATLVFVAHGGPLEAKSALLAASLAEYYIPGKIVCRTMEPVGHWGALSPEVAALLEALGIPMRPVRNEIDETYPHGNKIAALRDISGPAIFLDSDILLMCPFSWHPDLAADLAAKPADIDTYSRGGGSWARVWKLFDLPVPPKSHLSTAGQEPMRPYFNAGFIAVKDGDAFARMWIDTVRRIDGEARITNKRPWVDQIGLPVAAARLGWRIRDLGDAFNFPCHISPLDGTSPYFAHYHWPRIISESPGLGIRLQQLLDRHPVLRDILGRYEEWNCVLNPCPAQ